MAIGETISAADFKRRYSPQGQKTQNKTLDQKLGAFGRGLGKFFGGDVIGDALGTFIANRSGAAKELQNAPAIYHQGKEIVSAGDKNKPVFQGPSGKAVLGDVIKSAGTIASAALPGAGSLLGRAAQGAALGYATDVGERLISGKESPLKPGLGSAVGGALPFATALTGWLVKRGVALTTGATKEVIDRAVRNPTAVHRAIREYATTDATKMTLVDRAKGAVKDFLGRRNKEFAASTQKLTFSKPFAKDEIVDAFSKEIKRFKGRVTKDGLLFKDTPLTDTDVADLQTFWQKLNSWGDMTPTGVEDLRQAVVNSMDDFAATKNSRANVVLGNLKKFVTNGLEQRAPGYKQMLADYGRKTGTAQMLIKELNLTNNVKPSTQIGSILRLFRKDPEVIRSLTKAMGRDEAENLLNELSGAILSEWLPIGATRQAVESLGTIGGLYGVMSGGLTALPTAGAIASASPRIVGEAATLTGRALNTGLGTGLRRAATIGAGRAGN